MHASKFSSSPENALWQRLPRMRNRHFLALDALILLLTPALALYLRLDNWSVYFRYFPSVCAYTVTLLVVRLMLFQLGGLYQRYWRSATVEELAHTVRVLLTATLLTCGVFWLGNRFASGGLPLPRSLPILDSLLVLLGVGGVRFSMRWANSYHLQRTRQSVDAPTRRVLIIGAGDAGQLIARELRNNPQLGLLPVGFIDDDPYKQNLRIQNLPVLGTRADLVRVVDEHRVEQAVIAMPTAPGKTIREFVDLCEEAKIPAQTMPGMYEILNGKVAVSQLRQVQIEDLLRREPIQTDTAAVRHLLRGKRVLVTGGGGSIGSELCRQVLACEPSELIILGHGENTVFDCHNELLKTLRQTPGGEERTLLHPVICDIRMAHRVRHVFERHRPQVVFHAAAHKHVPLMEANPPEAISNNVFGTQHLLDAALEVGTDHFVMISTDKVVNPTSVMGASKRVAELLVMRAAQKSGKAFVAVRFGNVLGSRGSVVPIFKQQIAQGGPVTVSHPDMTRYFMTIPEAVQLVLQAGAIGRGGEVFMLDMGSPVKIVDLARDLIELSGLEVDRDIEIVFTGMRPGEKLFEELLLSNEMYEPTAHEKIRLARKVTGYLPAHLDAVLMKFRQAVADDDGKLVRRCLLTLIPEYSGAGEGALPLNFASVSEREEEAILHQAVTQGSQGAGREEIPFLSART